MNPKFASTYSSAAIVKTYCFACFFTVCFGLFNSSSAQPNQWTWMSGPNISGQKGTYGTTGVASQQLTPGARYQNGYWKGPGSQLYIFGGQGYGISTGAFNNYLNDLWKWDGTAWTWLSGKYTTNSFGVYGTKGIAAATNLPGARSNPTTWTDNSGNLWLFGGEGFAASGPYGYLNDLWKWDGIAWTWISGGNVTSQLPTYGTKGVPAVANVPGARKDGLSWTDVNGNLWLFGGLGYNNSPSNGYLNDLWRWDGTAWTWISGSDVSNQGGTYGTKGIAAATNVPGARINSISWTDNMGNLWLFGGVGYASTVASNYLNDLWKWDGTAWTWISGSNSSSALGIYGTKGVSAVTNVPGARSQGYAWKDSNNNLWLFGGYGIAANSITGSLNDMWKWNGAAWTWMSGDNIVNPTSNYGTKGVAASTNNPGGRFDGGLSPDATGNIWIFSGSGVINDLWKWDGAAWTWISGSNQFNQFGNYFATGITSPQLLPGSRWLGGSWSDNSGNLWLWGGSGYTYETNTGGFLNDMWKWNGSMWTWVHGNFTGNKSGNYGIKGVAAPTNIPGGREHFAFWKDNSGNFWLFGGNGYATDPNNTGYLNDLWKWDGSNWTWINGSSIQNPEGVTGTQGVAAPGNVPSGRYNSFFWVDNAGNFWLFGGTAKVSGTQTLLNDLWKWDGTAWTWINGNTSSYQYGVYGTKGVAASGNAPGSRCNGTTWKDNTGNLWLFGGDGYAATGSEGNLNDLWKWNGTAWTWMSGTNSRYQPGVYGTQGVPNAANTPGARTHSSYWIDATGTFWLYGGVGMTTSSSQGLLNDFWRWDGNNWTWISGHNIFTNQAGVYGTQGVTASTNHPGGRYAGYNWTDATGNLWTFGGAAMGNQSAYNFYINDLWKYNLSNPLPITLTHFIATKRQAAAVLTWEVSRDQNISVYQVQRSTGSQPFTTIETIPPSLTSGSNHTYSYRDDQPTSGNNYYRLKMVEKDGSSTFSEVRSLYFGDRITVSVYPNPSKGQAFVSGPAPGMLLRVVNAVGQPVITKTVRNTTTALSFTGLDDGIYQVQVLGNNGILLSTVPITKR